MAIKKFQTKDLRDMEHNNIPDDDEEYFFPDINIRPVTVKAKNREDAEKKAKEINKHK